MAKVKTLQVQKKSVKGTPNLKIKKGVNVIEYSPTQELLDETFKILVKLVSAVHAKV
jgi:hypothetical protein